MFQSIINKDVIFNIINDIKNCIELRNKLENEKEDNKEIIKEISESIKQNIESDKLSIDSVSIMDDKLKIIGLDKKDSKDELKEEIKKSITEEVKQEVKEEQIKKNNIINKSKLLKTLNESINIGEFIKI